MRRDELEELADQLKDRYPELEHLTDEDVVSAAIRLGFIDEPSNYRTTEITNAVVITQPNNLEKRPPDVISRFGSVEVLSTNLQTELDRAIESRNGGMMYNWFRRQRSESRTKTNIAIADEINSIGARITAYATQASHLQRLPHLLHQQHLIEDAQLRNQLILLSNEQKMAVLAAFLIEDALKAGLPLDKYLIKLDQQQEVEHKRAIDAADLDKLERQKDIEYNHEQRMFDAKVTSAVDYANTPHLVWMKKNDDLKRLYKEVSSTENDRSLSPKEKERIVARIEKQIAKLEGELDGQPDGAGQQSI